jgi:hypothetical protein
MTAFISLHRKYVEHFPLSEVYLTYTRRFERVSMTTNHPKSGLDSTPKTSCRVYQIGLLVSETIDNAKTKYWNNQSTTVSDV